MALKLSYEKQEDIPEAYRDLFEEKNGKWELTGIEGLKTQKDVDAQKSAADKERKLRVEMQDKLKRYEKLHDVQDLDVDALLTAREELEETKKQLADLTSSSGKVGETKKLIDEAVAAERQRNERALKQEQAAHAATKKTLADEQGRVTQLDGTIRKGKIEAELSRAGAAAKLRPEAMSDLLRYSDAFEVDDEGKVVTKDGVGFTPGIDAASWLTDLKSQKVHWWPESTGGGARGSGGNAGGNGKNPFAKGSFDIMGINRLVKEDPARAMREAKAAGYDDIDTAIRLGARASQANGTGGQK